MTDPQGKGGQGDGGGVAGELCDIMPPEEKNKRGGEKGVDG